MKQFINGREYDVPVQPDGSIDSEDLKRFASIPENRSLVLKRQDGSNYLVNPGDRVIVRPGEHYADAPYHTRGA